MHTVLEQVGKIGIVPVVVIDDKEDAGAVADALCKGGIPCAEVTFRTDAAADSIRIMKERWPDMLIGAGTVLTIEQAKEAVKAGASFIVSPGFNPKVVSYCLEQGIPIAPGVSTPTEIEAALEFGLEVVKFFPAEASGGIDAIKAMAAPYKHVKFMPTGGITGKNLKEYLSFSSILACGGSWMVSKELIGKKEFAKIQELTEEAVFSMLDFSLMHVGINFNDEKKATEAAGSFSDLFGSKVRPGNSSVFSGTMFEAVKHGTRGDFGHLAIGTAHIDRARYYLESRGYTFEEESALYKNGLLNSIYLEHEIEGMALHLLQK